VAFPPRRHIRDSDDIENSPFPTAGKGLALDLNGNLPASVAALSLRVLTADPTSPVVGECWYRSDTSQLCIRHDSSTTKRVTLA
jgi:hypothetical protein